MRANIPLLEKRAIKLALTESWADAIEINQEILQDDPNNLKAKIRLGRAYLQIKDFKKAEKLFKGVLDNDPINQVAQKNYELAKNKQIQHSTKNINASSFVKEPGTTIETGAKLTARGILAGAFSYGQTLTLIIEKDKVMLMDDDKLIGEISDIDVAKRLNQAKRIDAEVNCIYLKGTDKEISVLISSSLSVFKATKQEVKPYMRKGSLDEPELEVENYDDVDES